MGRITINGTMSQLSCKLTVRLLSGMPKPTKPPAKASNRRASTRSWKISRPISVSNANVSATVIRMLRPKRSAMPSSVWAMIAACCCYRPSTAGLHPTLSPGSMSSSNTPTDVICPLRNCRPSWTSNFPTTERASTGMSSFSALLRV